MPNHMSNQQYLDFIKAQNLASGRYYGDAHFLESLGGPGSELVLNSFTGPDITCSLLMPPEETASREAVRDMGISNPDEYFAQKPTLKTFAELETISISSARSVFGVRRLGEHHVHKYTRGARTIAGTMVFSMLSRDVFAEFYRLHGSDTFIGGAARGPMHVDQMPPFNILIQAANEYGAIANSALIDVHLTNWGTTLSVHDLKLESTYTYVAQMFFPFVQDTEHFQREILKTAASSSSPLSDAMTKRRLLYDATGIEVPDLDVERRMRAWRNFMRQTGRGL